MKENPEFKPAVLCWKIGLVSLLLVLLVEAELNMYIVVETWTHIKIISEVYRDMLFLLLCKMRKKNFFSFFFLSFFSFFFFLQLWKVFITCVLWEFVVWHDLFGVISV